MSGPRTWRHLWGTALYGPRGFYRRAAPGDHFRTSVHASAVFADAIARLARTSGLATVVDLGSGGGELLAGIDRSFPDEFTLVGVDLAARPTGLAAAIEWTHELPDSFDGLLVANELLDNVPCEIVEADDDGIVRVVHVDAATGSETLGARCADPWLDRWWPGLAPGERAEVGSPRDDVWADAVSRIGSGVAVAIDYGHLAAGRPPLGSVRSYLEGREVDVRLDGSRDVTAHVAVDSVADRVGGTLRRQRDVLVELGVSGARPPLALSQEAPLRYVRELSAASEAAELLESGGLGDFWWIVSEHGEAVVPTP